MTELQVFLQTSDVPYDRHTYEIVLVSGKKLKFDYYEEAQAYWWQNCQMPDYLKVMNVKDKKGFGPK